MLIPQITPLLTYQYTGVNTFEIPFPFYGLDTIVLGYRKSSNIDDIVYYFEYGVDFQVSGTLSPNNDNTNAYLSGTVTLLEEGINKLENNWLITLQRNTPGSQSHAYNEQDNFPAKSHENALGYNAVGIQELQEAMTRAIIIPPGSDMTVQEFLEQLYETVTHARLYAQGTDAEMTAEGLTPSSAKTYAEACSSLKSDIEGIIAAYNITMAENLEKIIFYHDNMKAYYDSLSEITAEAITLPSGEEATVDFDTETNMFTFGIPCGCLNALIVSVPFLDDIAYAEINKELTISWSHSTSTMGEISHYTLFVAAYKDDGKISDILYNQKIDYPDNSFTVMLDDSMDEVRISVRGYDEFGNFSNEGLQTVQVVDLRPQIELPEIPEDGLDYMNPTFRIPKYTFPDGTVATRLYMIDGSKDWVDNWESSDYDTGYMYIQSFALDSYEDDLATISLGTGTRLLTGLSGGLQRALSTRMTHNNDEKKTHYMQIAYGIGSVPNLSSQTSEYSEILEFERRRSDLNVPVIAEFSDDENNTKNISLYDDINITWSEYKDANYYVWAIARGTASDETYADYKIMHSMSAGTYNKTFSISLTDLLGDTLVNKILANPEDYNGKVISIENIFLVASTTNTSASSSLYLSETTAGTSTVRDESPRMPTQYFKLSVPVNDYVGFKASGTTVTLSALQEPCTIDWGDGESTILTSTVYSTYHTHNYADGLTEHTINIKFAEEGLTAPIMIASGTTYRKLCSSMTELIKLNLPGATTLNNIFRGDGNYGGSGGTQFVKIHEGALDGCTSLVSTSNLFSYNTKLTEEYIPEGLFNGLPNLTSITTAISNTGITATPKAVAKNCTNLTTFNNVFGNCDSLVTATSDFVENCPNITSLYGLFYGCDAITSIPNNFFQNTPNITTVASMFHSCTKMGIVPKTAFTTYTPKLYQFTQLFRGCTNMFGAVPELWTIVAEDGTAATGNFCWADITTARLTNYSSIPSSWISG